MCPWSGGLWGPCSRLREDPCPGPHGRTFPDDLPGLRELMQAGLLGTSDVLATLLTWSGKALRIGGPWGWGRGSLWLFSSVLRWALGRDGAHLCVPLWCSQSPGGAGRRRISVEPEVLGEAVGLLWVHGGIGVRRPPGGVVLGEWRRFPSTGAGLRALGFPFSTEMQMGSQRPCPFPSTSSACPLWCLSNLPAGVGGARVQVRLP